MHLRTCYISCSTTYHTTSYDTLLRGLLSFVFFCFTLFFEELAWSKRQNTKLLITTSPHKTCYIYYWCCCRKLYITRLDVRQSPARPKLIATLNAIKFDTGLSVSVSNHNVRFEQNRVYHHIAPPSSPPAANGPSIDREMTSGVCVCQRSHSQTRLWVWSKQFRVPTSRKIRKLCCSQTSCRVVLWNICAVFPFAGNTL